MNHVHRSARTAITRGLEPNVSAIGPWLEATYAAAHDGRECPARIVIKSNPHDFGSYLEVGVKFDDRDREQVEAAFWLEANAPVEWPDRTLCEARLSHCNSSTVTVDPLGSDRCQ